MKIGLDGIKNGFLGLSQAGSDKIGLLVNHAVKWLDTASQYAQDKHLALGIVVLSNFSFIELAIGVTRLFAKCADHFFVSMDKLPEGYPKSIRALQLSGVFFTTVITCNYALYRGLRLPFTPFVMTAMCVASCSVYLFFKTDFLSNY